MSVYVVDVEADGPASGLFSMVSFGAVRLDRELATTFYGRVAPVFERFDPEALAISGASREEHLSYPKAEDEMRRFALWIKETNIGGAPKLVSDNPAFDWQWINWYCHSYLGENPFGSSARRVGDFCAGLEGRWEATSTYRALGKTPHTHHPVDDAKRVAEGLIAMADARSIKLPGVAKLSPAPGAKA